jgi:hypothetical protein
VVSTVENQVVNQNSERKAGARVSAANLLSMPKEKMKSKPSAPYRTPNLTERRKTAKLIESQGPDGGTGRRARLKIS